MFFSQDVLFKDGPLALIWMAGNEEFKSQALKNKRNKHYVAMLSANIGELSDLIRKQFPKMGTAYGLSLKKTSVLVKGLVAIYLSQIQHLSWSMHDTHLRMQSSNVRRLRAIDLPAETPSRHQEPRHVAADPLVSLGFGDLNETDLMGDGTGPRCFTTNEDVPAYDHHQPQVIPTPGPEERGNRRKKRKRGQGQEEGLDEDGVLERMREALAQNQNAHTIRDADPIPNPSRDDGFGDFGQGFDFMMPDMGNMQSLQDEARVTEEFQGPEMISAEERLISPERGGTTTRDLDDGAGRHGRRRPRRRGLSDNEFDVEPAGLHTIQEEQGGAAPVVENNSQDDLQLESLPNVPRTQPRGRKRRRHPLDIDAEPQIPMDEIRRQLQQQKRPLDYDECRKEMDDDRRDSREKKLKANPIEFMLGKYNSRRMKEDKYRRKDLGGFGNFIAGCHNVALEERQRSDRQVGDAERGDSEATDEGSGMRAAEEVQPGQGSSYVRPFVSGSILNIPGAGLSEMDPPLLQEMDNIEYQPELPQIFIDPPAAHDDDADVRGGGVVIDELENGRFVFKELFPPGTTSRKKAATAFFQFLRMQSMHKVTLKQEEPYGDIFVTKL